MIDIFAYIFATNPSNPSGPTVGTEFAVTAKRLEVFIDGSIGQFKLYLNNLTDASALLEPGQFGAFGVDGHTLIKGFIDDVSPETVDETAVFDKYVTVEGRSVGRDLARMFIKTNFVNNRDNPLYLGDIFNIGLLSVGSQISCDYSNMWNQDKGPVIDHIEANDMYLLDLFNDAVEKANYNYTVNWDDSKLYAWPLANTPHTDVLLNMYSENNTDGKILLINPYAKIGNSIYNYVKIKAGSLNDHWTERTATFLATNSSTIMLYDDTTVFIVGNSSIRANCNNTYYRININSGVGIVNNLINITAPSVCFNFPLFNCQSLDYSNIPSENCSVNITHDKSISAAPDEILGVITITDDKGHKLYWLDKGFNRQWNKKFEFVLGYNAPTPRAAELVTAPTKTWLRRGLDIWDYKDFTWNIVSLEIGIIPHYFVALLAGTNEDGYFTGNFWVDGLMIPSLGVEGGAFAVAQDYESMQRYGKSMIAVYRPDLKSQRDLQKVADETLELSKAPFYELTLVCKYIPDLVYTGLLVDVQVPEYNIGTAQNPEVYRILSIRHVAEAGEDLCRGHEKITELKLIRHEGGKNVSAGRLRQSSNSSVAANVSVQRRIETLEDASTLIAAAITGAGGGSGGSDWNGGVVSNTIDVQCKMPFLNELNNEVYKFLMTPMIELQQQYDYSAFINFHNIAEPGASTPNLMQDLNIYGVFVSNGQHHNPGLMVGHHLLYRGDFMGRGIMSSLEGCIVLHGGLIPQGVPGAGGKVCGWAPTQNPFIWLAQGGQNTAANTLEIRTRPLSGWAWGNLAVANITSHGNITTAALTANDFVSTNHLSTLSGLGQITLYSGLKPDSNHTKDLGEYYTAFNNIFCRYGRFSEVFAPQGVTTQAIINPSNSSHELFRYDSSGNRITLNANVTVTGSLSITGGAANPFNQNLNTYNAVTFTDVTMTGSSTISGSLIVRNNLDVTHLRADGPYAIVLYSDIIPSSSGRRIGTSSNPFSLVYSKLFEFTGCERSLSGQEWHQQIQNENDAIDVLTHQVTKTVYHTTYNLETTDEIICTCGKSVKTPCPEHEEAYRERYTKSVNKQLEATAYLTLEHAADLARLENALSEANERNSLLEQRIAKLEQSFGEVKNA